MWSLGVTLMECAMGNPPFPKMQNVFEFMNYLAKNPVLQLPSDKFSPGFLDFISNCLITNPSTRPGASQMIVIIFFIVVASLRTSV